MSTAENNSPRYHYLDGVRALAALYVVLYHTFCEVAWKPSQWLPDSGGIAPGVAMALGWVKFGWIGVSIFIVLSGYSLMIPVARSEGELKGGLRGFFTRRARRIIPPYWAALALYLLAIALVPGLNQDANVRWDEVLPAFTPDVLLSHLLLFHDLRIDWFWKIAAPLWSVAVEWHIYLLFPLLVFIWRRGGWFSMMGFGLAVGSLLTVLTHLHYGHLHAWYICLFVLGMGAASLNFSSQQWQKAMCARLPWNWLSLIFATVLIVHQAGYLPRPYAFWRSTAILDMLVGCSAASLLVFCTHAEQQGRTVAALRLFSWRPLVALGVFSYSVYLIHDLVLGAGSLALRSLNASPTVHLGVLFFAGLPLILLLAYRFHLVFERPFLSGLRSKNLGKAKIAPQIQAQSGKMKAAD